MTRFHAWAIGAILAGPLAVSSPAVAAPTGELWETRLTMTSPAHGEMAMPPQRICQPAVDRNPASIIPSISEDCPGLEQRREGDRVLWSGTCPQGRVDGEIRFVGRDRLEGRMGVDSPDGRFEMRFEGERLGACTPEDE